MGRPRKPTNLKILEGDQPCRINTSEPKSPEGLGDPPEWFDPYAKAAWARLVVLLGPMKVAKRSDSEAAMVYCQAYSTWRQALEVVEAEGMMVESVTESTTKNGSMTREVKKANPLLPTVREAQRQMMQCLSVFGMTPASRAGLSVMPDPGDDKLLAFLNRGGANGKRDRKAT